MAGISIIFESIEQKLNHAGLAERQKQHQHETRKYREQTHVFTVMKQLNIDGMSQLNETNRRNIRKMIHYLFRMDYSDMINSMGMSSTLVELSYMEKKAVKEAIVPALHIYCGPMLTFLSNLNPIVFCPEQIHAEMLEWSEKRKRAEQRLMDAKCNYIKSLQAFVNLKFSPRQRDAVESIRLDVELNKIKTELLTNITKGSICAPIHAVDAMRFVQQQLTEDLKKKNTVDK